MTTPDSPNPSPQPSQWFEQSQPVAAGGVNPPSGAATPADTPSGPDTTYLPPPAARGLRMRTIVFGLLLLLLATTVTIGHYTAVHIDGAAVAIGALIAAGVLLLIGSLSAVARERRAAR